MARRSLITTAEPRPGGAEGRRGETAPARGRPALVVALASALAAAACAAPEPAAPAAATPAAEQAPALDAVPAPPPPEERLAEVRRLLREGQIAEGRAGLDALRREGVPDSLLAEVDLLDVALRREALEGGGLVGQVRLDRDRVAIGELVTGTLCVGNETDEPVVLLAEERSGGGALSLGTIAYEVRITDFGPDGVYFRDEMRWSERFGRDIALGPGARHTWLVSLDPSVFRAERASYRRLRITARLLPAAVESGGRRVPAQVRFADRVAHVFPRNFEHLMVRPLERLKEAVAKESAPHVPVAAALLAPEERADAVRWLVSVLKGDGGVVHGARTLSACCMALAVLTGEELAATPETWVARAEETRWWTARN